MPRRPLHTGPVVPFDRLPEGFARRVDDPPDPPAEAVPAAAAVPVRDGEGGLELLLVRRSRSAGFVPGAYVFPGGRVDPSDATARIARRVAGVTPEALARRLRTGDREPPALAYLAAALREMFEETGLLLARTREGNPAPAAAEDPLVSRLREELLAGSADFSAVLEELDLRLDGGAVAYAAHWITPVVEPRRYDTRFFAARVPAGKDVSAHARELTDVRWLAPGAALAAHRRGELPMVFPTVRTLEDLSPFSSAGEVLDHFRRREIPSILPRLLRTPTGVAIQVPRPE